jgi:hypothetical protein
MFLISAFIASQTANYFKEYSSEESKIKREKVKMDRLKADLIKKSRKIEHASKSTSYSNKIKKIYRVALSPRGGEINDFLIQGALESEFSAEFTISQRIRDMILKTLIYLKTREENADKLRLIFLVARLGLNLILVRCNINIDYLVDDGVPKTVKVIAVCTGGTFGFIYGWLTAGILIAAPPTILSALMIKSLAQQYMHQKNYQELMQFQHRLATDEKFRNEILQSMREKHKQFVENYNKVNLENLNWNANPKIKQAAERLGIFENPPEIAETLHIDTVDFNLELEEMLDRLGLLTKPKEYDSETLNEFIRSKLESRGEVKVYKIPEKITSSEDVIDIS